MKILVTGATGFVGGALVRHLASENKYEIIASTRRKSEALEKVVKCEQVADLSESTDWLDALSGIDVVVHCAAKVDDINGKEKSLPDEFYKVNVLGTLNLARQAASKGVKRFVFISSIKAMGEKSLGRPFSADDEARPTTPYGISKYEAEQGLKQIAKETGMELVIIRPPLVYNAGCANSSLSVLLKLAKFRIPLPFASLRSTRSVVSTNNLVDFISVCIVHPAAANQIFLISDGKDLSTAQMLKNVTEVSGKRLLLIPFPELLLKFILQIVGKKEIAQRICSSLQVDIEKNKKLLGWVPKY